VLALLQGHSLPLARLFVRALQTQFLLLFLLLLLLLSPSDFLDLLFLFPLFFCSSLPVASSLLSALSSPFAPQLLPRQHQFVIAARTFHTYTQSYAGSFQSPKTEPARVRFPTNVHKLPSFALSRVQLYPRSRHLSSGLLFAFANCQLPTGRPPQLSIGTTASELLSRRFVTTLTKARAGPRFPSPARLTGRAILTSPDITRGTGRLRGFLLHLEHFRHHFRFVLPCYHSAAVD
jgi:hypothetical protein